MIRHRGVLTFLVKLSTILQMAEAESFGLTYLDEQSLCISSEEDILFMIQAADALVKNDHNPGPSH